MVEIIYYSRYFVVTLLILINLIVLRYYIKSRDKKVLPIFIGVLIYTLGYIMAAFIPYYTFTMKEAEKVIVKESNKLLVTTGVIIRQLGLLIITIALYFWFSFSKKEK